MSKVIVFDLDKTLRSIDPAMTKSVKENVIIRPAIIELLKKLQDVKKQGVDCVIFTNVSYKSANKDFLDLLPDKYRQVFTKVITAESYIEPDKGTRENYLYSLGDKKMVTALGYDEILFFDANKAEYDFWKEAYDEKISKKYPTPDKSLTLVSLPFCPIKEAEMYSLKELAKDKNLKNNELVDKINSFFDLTLKEPGCRIMIDMIDVFVSNDHENELTFIDGTEEYNNYYKHVNSKHREIDDIIYADMSIADKYRNKEEEYYDDQIADAQIADGGRGIFSL